MGDHPSADAASTAPTLCGASVTVAGRQFAAWHGLMAVVAVALILRLWGLGNRSFFGDEVYSLQIAEQKTAAQLLHHAQKLERHPPLPHLISRVIYLAGAHGEFQWRLFGAFCGVAITALAFLVPLYFGAPQLSLPAGMLAATAPMGVLFSQVNRWYPLAGALLGLAILCTVIGARRGSLGAWIGAGLALALAFYTVYLAAAVGAVILLMALVHLLRRRAELRGWMWAVAVTVLCTAPWLPYFLPMLHEGKIQLDPTQTTLSGLGKAVLLLQNLAVGPTVLPWSWAVNLSAAALYLVLLMALVRSEHVEVRRTSAAAGWFMVLCFPIMLVASASSAPRYWLVLLVPWTMLVAGGLVSLRSAVGRGLAVAALAALIGYGLVNLYTVRQYQYLELADDWPDLAAHIRVLEQPGDEVWTLASPFVYYYGDAAEYVMDWGWDPDGLRQHLTARHPHRIILQYSPLSGWEGTPFERVARTIGGQLEDAGYRRQWQKQWGRDPQVEMKRRYLRGRTFPEYRHAAELWVHEPQ